MRSSSVVWSRSYTLFFSQDFLIIVITAQKGIARAFCGKIETFTAMDFPTQKASHSPVVHLRSSADLNSLRSLTSHSLTNAGSVELGIKGATTSL